MYTRNPDWDWEDYAVGGMTGLVVLLAIAAAAILATLIVVLGRELFRIFAERASTGTTAGRILWAALATFLLIAIISMTLLIALATAGAGLLLLSWAFLAFVVVAEGVDLYEGRHDQEQLATAGELETYLDSFAPAPDAEAHVGVGSGGR